MSQIAQFSNDDVSNAVATIIVQGKTASERKLNVIMAASDATRLFAANMTGAVGKAARSRLQDQGIDMIASAASRGSYRPLAEALSLLTGESVSIASRASYMSLADRYQPALDTLAFADKAYKNGKMTSKAAALQKCLDLLQMVQDGVSAIIAQRNEERAA